MMRTMTRKSGIEGIRDKMNEWILNRSEALKNMENCWKMHFSSNTKTQRFFFSCQIIYAWLMYLYGIEHNEWCLNNNKCRKCVTANLRRCSNIVKFSRERCSVRRGKKYKRVKCTPMFSRHFTGKWVPWAFFFVSHFVVAIFTEFIYEAISTVCTRIWHARA